uniref:Uncharacterized protein n=1 Tax=Anopheles maculatus TaxID=74869 RepID=A0A182SNP2_9DIPT
MSNINALETKKLTTVRSLFSWCTLHATYRCSFRSNALCTSEKPPLPSSISNRYRSFSTGWLLKRDCAKGNQSKVKEQLSNSTITTYLILVVYSFQLADVQISLALQLLHLELQISILLLECALAQLQYLVTLVILLQRERAIAAHYRVRLQERTVIAIMQRRPTSTTADIARTAPYHSATAHRHDRTRTHSSTARTGASPIGGTTGTTRSSTGRRRIISLSATLTVGGPLLHQQLLLAIDFLPFGSDFFLASGGEKEKKKRKHTRFILHVLQGGNMS